MRPTTRLSLFAATAFAFSATAAAAPDGIMYLVTTTQKAVADKDHKGEQIEIQSFSWGPRQSTSVDGGRDLGSWSKADGLEVSMGASAPTGRQAASRPSSDMVMKGSKIGENAPASRPGTAIGGAIGGWANDGDEAAAARRSTGINQMSMDDTAGKEKARRGSRTVDANETITIHGGRTESDPDRPLIAGTVPNTAAGRRQHGAVTISKEWGAATPQVAKPRDNSSVWIRVGTPWTACRAGTRYPAVELVEGAASYQLSDVVVTSCEAGGASLSYAKVKVRGWDPAKKEE